MRLGVLIREVYKLKNENIRLREAKVKEAVSEGQGLNRQRRNVWIGRSRSPTMLLGEALGGSKELDYR